MTRLLRCGLLLIAGNAFWPLAADAQQSANDGGRARPWPQLLGPQLFTSWNGGAPAVVLKPGPKVLFFGRGAGCAAGTSGGPVSADSVAGADEKQSLRRLTGLAPGDQNRRWMPSGDAPGCDASVRQRRGDSLVFVNPDRGVALYTASEAGQRAFWGPFDAKGQNGSGANAHIEGTFVNFREAWQRPDALRPWPNAGAEIQFSSVQSVATVDTGPASAGGEARQVKQQIIASFINTTCSKESAPARRLCQIQYLFNTGIYRSGVSDWSKIGWFRQAGLFGDPGQGGLPVIHGPIDPAGQVTRDSSSGLPVYRSEGSATRHELFDDQRFDLRISFEQLLNALHIVVGRKLGKAAAQVDDAQMQAEFGSAWNSPGAWVLVSTDIAQEVYNAGTDSAARIGGSARSLLVSTVSQPAR